MARIPETLLGAARCFADADRCEELMRKTRWPSGKPVCPVCRATGDRIGSIATRRTLRCKDCRKQFSHKVGTIFEDSPLGLDKWFVAVWSIVNCKNGISSHELGRAIGVTQKTAWFMLHRIRKAIEIDGDANMHAKRREKNIRGRGALAALLRRLANVPKESVDEAIMAEQAERRKRRRERKR